MIPTSTTLNLTNGYTVAFWINVPAWPSQSTLVINKFVNAAEDKAIYIDADGTIGFFLAGATPLTAMLSGGLDSATALTMHTWHHVAATYNGTDANIYVDGLLDASLVASGNALNSTGSLVFAHNPARANRLTIGGTLVSTNTFFIGYLDEIRWYARSLSAAEVAALASGCN